MELLTMDHVRQRADALRSRMLADPQTAWDWSLEIVLARLPAAEAAACADAIIQAKVQLANKEPVKWFVIHKAGSATLKPLFSGYSETPPPLALAASYLSAEQAARHVDDLLTAMSLQRDAQELCNLAMNLRPLAERLPAEQADKALRRCVPFLTAGSPNCPARMRNPPGRLPVSTDSPAPWKCSQIAFLSGLASKTRPAGSKRHSRPRTRRNCER